MLFWFYLLAWRYAQANTSPWQSWKGYAWLIAASLLWPVMILLARILEKVPISKVVEQSDKIVDRVLVSQAPALVILSVGAIMVHVFMREVFAFRNFLEAMQASQKTREQLGSVLPKILWQNFSVIAPYMVAIAVGFVLRRYQYLDAALAEGLVILAAISTAFVVAYWAARFNRFFGQKLAEYASIAFTAWVFTLLVARVVMPESPISPDWFVRLLLFVMSGVVLSWFIHFFIRGLLR